MSTSIPVTLKGNLTGDPVHGTSDEGVEYARFAIAVNNRRPNETTGKWEDVKTVFHSAVVFDRQARHVVDSLRRGDQVLLQGNLKFDIYPDKDGKPTETRVIVADTVAASLQFTGVDVDRAPKANGPAAAMTEGPTAAPEATGAGIR